MAMTRRQWRLSMLLVGSLVFGWGVFLRGFPPNQAMISALSLVTLAYVCRRTYDELMRIYRNASSPSWEVEAASPSDEPAGLDSSPESDS